MTNSLLDPNPVPHKAADFTRDRQNRLIIGSGQISSPPVFSGLALLENIKTFLDMRDRIREVAEGVARQARIEEIRKQLAPGQSVIVFERSSAEKPKAISIARDLPGQGYIYDPEQVTAIKVSQPLDYCPLPDKTKEERKSFMVEGKVIELERETDDFKSEGMDQIDRGLLRRQTSDEDSLK